MMKPLFLHSSFRNAPVRAGTDRYSWEGPTMNREVFRRVFCSQLLNTYLPQDLLIPAFTYSSCKGIQYIPDYSRPRGCGLLSDYIFEQQKHLSFTRTLTQVKLGVYGSLLTVSARHLLEGALSCLTRDPFCLLASPP